MTTDGTPLHIVVMGVAGTGKTTVAAALAERLGAEFAEGDDFHSDANRGLMAAGVPLTDAHRWPWLRSLRDWMTARAGAGRSTVVACSALRRAYRDVLREADGDVVFVHLILPPELNRERLDRRTGHYMTGGMLASQLDTLEPLAVDERGVVVASTGAVEEVVAEAVRRVGGLIEPDTRLGGRG